MTTPSESRRSALGHLALVEFAGLAALLMGIVVRLFASIDPFPYWSGDPFEYPAHLTGIGPTFLGAIDLVVLAGAACVLLTCGLRGLRTAPWHLVLFLVGCGAVLYHAGLNERWTIEHYLEGSPLIAAMAAGLAVGTLSQDPSRRRLVVAVLLGALAMLVAKGAMQVFIEHPETLKRFRADRESFLAAQGWSPGSPSALAFERRLSQPEASAWIGLSNPYATLMAAGAVAFAGWFFAALRRREVLRHEPWVLPMLGAGLALCCTGVYLAGGKGGYGAVFIGLGVLGLTHLAARGRAGRAGPALTPARLGDSRWAGLLGPVIVAGVLGAVALRGVLGERIGELSILFRAFYIEAAARIFAEFPVLGVGPAGFKSAYLLAKNPLSPEEVSSPHSLFFDLAAKLGIGGLAWAGLVLAWSWRAGEVALRPELPVDEAQGPSARNESRLVLLVLAVPTLVAALLEVPMATPELAFMRLAGLLGAACIGAALLVAARPLPGAPFIAGAALAALAHGQIEVTPVVASTAPWFMALLGAAGARARPPALQPGPGPLVGISPRVARLLIAPVLLLALAGWIGVHHLARTSRWESHLRRGAVVAREVLEVRDVLQQANPAPGELQAAADTILRRLPHADRSLQGLRDLFPRYRDYRADDVLRLHLELAAIEAPSHFGTARAASRISMAPVYRGMREPNSRRLLNRTLRRSPDKALVQSWIGVISATVYEQSGDERALRRACSAWEEAAALDPYSTFHPIQLAQAYAKLGEAERAGEWAARALELDGLLRLDPIRQMPEAVRRRMEALRRPPG